jgi:nitrite reductase (NADH) small subunit
LAISTWQLAKLAKRSVLFLARFGNSQMLIAKCQMLTKLTTQSELPHAGEAREFPLGDKVICVANVNGTISAMDNVCLHRGGPLGQGVIEGDKVVCPWHGWQWDPKTGQAAQNPAAKVAVYPLKVEGDDVMIEL